MAHSKSPKQEISNNWVRLLVGLITVLFIALIPLTIGYLILNNKLKDQKVTVKSKVTKKLNL